ncbi:MAG: aldo/keto reductase [Candidatus Rokuibacteriota bacterium]|nr:MAG: aldo/keto reductase [Candidatus Rokubacteria bacterium]
MTTKMITGKATAKGTLRYAERLAARLTAGHFRQLDEGPQLSTLGLGTYLGADDGATDVLYQDAIVRALELGVNVLDTAVNYRHQRSERAIRTALATAIAKGVVERDEVLVATKGGFIPFDGAVPRDARAYFTATYLESGIVKPGEVVGGAHCMTPRYLRDQIDRSRVNLGLATLDVYYIHNPETQLGEVKRDEFMARIRAAFAALEEAVAGGLIGRYGTATWSGYREDPGAPGYLSLAELVAAARDVGGPNHHFKVIQLPYNLAMTEAFTRANQRVDKGMVPVLEAARQLDVYVMASASIYQGQLSRGLPPMLAKFLPGLETDAQRALQFARSTPGVGSALVGMKTSAHVDENAKVGATSPIAWKQFQRLFSAAGG